MAISQTPAINALRAHLRRQLLDARAALTPGDHSRLSAAVCAHLLPWFTARRPGSVGFCLPFRGECDILPLAHNLHRHGWQCAVPVAGAVATAMEFRYWEPDCPLHADRHGIAIPATATCAPPQVLLLPVVGVDPAGFRLGYGGGYFDRTIAALAQAGQRPLCVGVGFELARVASISPCAHDQRLDWLATEAGLHSLDGGALSRDDAG